jgi:Ser/Thr protein kinase RdoA (MazF antagonist)
MSTSSSTTTSSSSNNCSCGSPTLLSDEELRKLTKPVISHDLICSAASASYGPATVIQQLDSYDDCNFLIEINKTRYLLKVHNGVESADYITSPGASKIGFANALYRHVRSNGLLTNEVVPVKYGADVALPSSSPLLERSVQQKKSSPTRYFQVKEGDDVALCELPVLSPLYSPCILAVQLLTWVEGTTMSSARTLSIEGVADAGVFLGKLRHILDTFPEPLPASAKRFHAWDTKNIVTLRKYTNWIEDEHRQSLVHSVIDAFENELLPDSKIFPQGVIHGDFNDANILLDDCSNVAAVIDFGDSIFR